MIVLDPPYRYTPAKSVPQKHLDERYKLTDNSSDITRVQGVWDLYSAGMKESYRVLKKGGFLIVKCQDTIQDGLQYRSRIEIHNRAIKIGFVDKDEVVVASPTVGKTRWQIQKHLRKAHSYFLIFRKDVMYLNKNSVQKR